MFCRERFTRSLQENTIPRKLLSAMFAVASLFLPSNAGSPISNVYANVGESLNEDALLDDVKAEVLLTFYEFTNFHGRRAWMMAGNLTRMAIGLGLHQIDCGAGNASLSGIELEERRLVWWSVWKLDTAINALTWSPFGAESHSPGTALVSTLTKDFTEGLVGNPTQQFLPSNATSIWKSAESLLSTDMGNGNNMYMLAALHLRNVSSCLLLSHSRPSIDVAMHLAELRHQLPCMKFSLPEWYFEPAFQSAIETPLSHRIRLETLIILHM